MNSFRAIVFYHMGAIFGIMKGVHRTASASSYIFSRIHKATLQLPNCVATRKEQCEINTIEIKRKPQSVCLCFILHMVPASASQPQLEDGFWW